MALSVASKRSDHSSQPSPGFRAISRITASLSPGSGSGVSSASPRPPLGGACGPLSTATALGRVRSDVRSDDRSLLGLSMSEPSVCACVCTGSDRIEECISLNEVASGALVRIQRSLLRSPTELLTLPAALSAFNLARVLFYVAGLVLPYTANATSLVETAVG